ncbi:MAG: type II toxin-antitoxin system prevent-host-death family antitoxin [Planctomycetes bacterium]|nr:type II toxin-antitoxin system prevent-host-death family antitoxin [Planctomycetota bacterium]
MAFRDRLLGPLLERVEGGEQIVVTRRGKPIARIVPELPAPADRSSRHPLRGSVVSVAEDFDEPLVDLWDDAVP